MVHAATAFGDTLLLFMATAAPPGKLSESLEKVLRLLLAAGLNHNQVNAQGQTALDVAIKRGATGLADALRPSSSPIKSPPMSPALIAARVAGGEGVMGAVHEGYLHLLERKKKEWIKTYYAIVPLLNDRHGTGHGDFANIMQASDSLEDMLAGKLTDKMDLNGAEVKWVTGTVFSLKTAPEVSKSRTIKISADTLDEVRAWMSSFELVPGVVVSWVDSKGAVLSPEPDGEA